MRYQADTVETVKNILDEYREVAQSFLETVESLSEDIKSVNRKKILYKKAFLGALRFLSGKINEIVLSVMLEAVKASVEYDYPPFINKIIEAVSNHNDLVTIIPDEEKERINVDINLYRLGTIDSWVDATVAAREAMNAGELRDIDIDYASFFWKEKVYAAGREGATIIKEKRKKSGQYIQIDETEKWAQIYETTINLRLSFLKPGEAPFWYLLEYGNTSPQAKKAFGSGGTPYPIVAPQRMQRKIAEIVIKVFKELYEIGKKGGEDELLKEILDDYNLTDLGEKLKSELYKSAEVTAEKLFEMIPGYERKTIGKRFKEDVALTEEAFSTTKHIWVRFRDPRSGRFSAAV